MSVSQVSEALHRVLEEEARALAKETGFIQRERALTGADFAQSLIFGWLAEPHLTLCGLSQVAGRREVNITASGFSQRFTEQAATFLQRLLHRLTEVRLHPEPEMQPLLSRFPAVIVEDSTQIKVPPEVGQRWAEDSEPVSQIKVFVRLDLVSGQVSGPLLTTGTHADCKSPFPLEDVPEGALYLADLGFFSLGRLQRLAHPLRGKKRFFVTRLKGQTALFTRGGHRLTLLGLLPTQPGEVRELGVRLARHAPVAVRLLMQRVPEEVANERRARLREEARDRGKVLSEEALYLAGWTIVVTNVPTARLSSLEVLVLLGGRWQIERLFLVWKQDGGIDKWNSHHRWRIQCELLAKLAAMLIQQWLLALGCWQDPEHSMSKAAQVVRRECNRLMVALWEGNVEHVLSSILRCLDNGCRVEKRRRFPSFAQRLASATTPLTPRGARRKNHRARIRYWPCGKGWACSGRASRRNTPAVFLT